MLFYILRIILLFLIPQGSSPFGFTLAQTSTFGTTSHPSLPAFGSSIFRSSVPWGAQSQSVFGACSNPGSASTTPAVGIATPSFRATSTPAFAAFGSTGSPLSGCGSAFGSSSNAISGASGSPSFSFGSSPAFGPSQTAFRSNQFESGSYGADRGSRVAPFTPTEEEETGQMGHCKLQSICGMPAYKCKSHEELRWEDYQLGDKGGPNHAGQSGVSVGPGASAAVPCPAFGQSSPFSSTTASNAVSSAAASATTSNPYASTPFGNHGFCPSSSTSLFCSSSSLTVAVGSPTFFVSLIHT